MKLRTSLSLLFAVVILALPLSVLAAGYVPDEILVQYKPGSRSAVSASSEKKGMRVRKSIDQIRFHVLKLPKGLSVERAIEKLKSDPNIEYVGPNHKLHICAPQVWPNDPVFYYGYDVLDMGIFIQPNQWGLYNDGYNIGFMGLEGADIKAPEAWAITTGSSSVIIADVDTGVDNTHPDLSEGGKVLPGYNAMLNNSDSMDDNGHGTFTSGIAAACSDNAVGITGVSWGSPILPVKVIEADGSGAEADAAEGIIWAVDQGAKVLNMSFATDLDVPALKQAIDYAWDHGCLSVCASGNEGVGTLMYPAAYANALAVGATNEYDERCTAADWGSGGSNYGSYLDIVAPGNNITSTWTDPEPTVGQIYLAAPGTSAATPFVAGIAALVWSIHPDWTNAQVKRQIEHTADDKGDPGWDQYYGWGRANAYRALTETLAPPATSIGALRSSPAGTEAQLTGKVVTAGSSMIPNMAYIEEPDRACGIGIYYSSGVPSGFALGDRVNVTGTLGYRNGEPIITGATMTKASTGAQVGPLGLTGKSASDGASGIACGLLVKVWGKVTEVGWDYFYLDDGSGLLDSTGIAAGIRISTPTTVSYLIGDKVSVIGALGLDLPSGAPSPVPVIRPRKPTDMYKP